MALLLSPFTFHINFILYNVIAQNQCYISQEQPAILGLGGWRKVVAPLAATVGEHTAGEQVTRSDKISIS